MENTVILSHGGGGDKTNELITTIFASHFANPLITHDDAAVLPIGDTRLAFTTDGFIVSPLFFPGGNIGTLSVCGTVNDLACMGAKPLWLSAAFVLEEGFPLHDLSVIAESMAAAAKKAGVAIVCGDTKVASKGQVDKVFITTSGIGRLDTSITLSGDNAQDGDIVLVTGDIGRHGATILVAREEFGIEASVTSDCAPLADLVQSLLAQSSDIHCIRDATRGGVGTVLYEICAQSSVGMTITANDIPVDPAVGAITAMLGLDPLYLACEGRMVIIAKASSRDLLLQTLHSHPLGTKAAVIGRITKEYPGQILVETPLGAKTRLQKPTGELLPRIC